MCTVEAGHNAESVAEPTLVGHVDQFGEITLDVGLRHRGWRVLVAPPEAPPAPKCGARTWLTGDEDGPLPRPIEIFCKKTAGHLYSHFNGYMNWDQDVAADVLLNDGDPHG